MGDGGHGMTWAVDYIVWRCSVCGMTNQTNARLAPEAECTGGKDQHRKGRHAKAAESLSRIEGRLDP